MRLFYARCYRILAAFQAEDGQTETARTHARSGVTARDVPGLPEQLSRREKEVLALLAERFTNREIGERLHISTATVKRHAHSIYDKPNVKVGPGTYNLSSNLKGIVG